MNGECKVLEGLGREKVSSPVVGTQMGAITPGHLLLLILFYEKSVPLWYIQAVVPMKLCPELECDSNRVVSGNQ